MYQSVSLLPWINSAPSRFDTVMASIDNFQPFLLLTAKQTKVHGIAGGMQRHS